MFWASAPDAFEVLKGDDLLVKYDVKVGGIPEKVGSFPINDPEGYYKGFAHPATESCGTSAISRRKSFRPQWNGQT